MSFPKQILVLKSRVDHLKNQPQAQQYNTKRNGSRPDNTFRIMDNSQNDSIANLKDNNKRGPKTFGIKQHSMIQFVNDLTHLYKENYAEPNVFFNFDRYDSIGMHSFVLLARSAWFRRSWRGREDTNSDYNFNSKIIFQDGETPAKINHKFEFKLKVDPNDESELFYSSFIEFSNYSFKFN